MLFVPCRSQCLHHLYTFSCKTSPGAVKFNHSLNRDECHSLVTALSSCRLPFQCAHGRPSIIPLVDFNHLDKDQKVPQCPKSRFNSEETVVTVNNLDIAVVDFYLCRNLRSQTSRSWDDCTKPGNYMEINEWLFFFKLYFFNCTGLF